jgi:hypothetical protein
MKIAIIRISRAISKQPIGILGNNDCQDLIPAEDFLFQFKVEEPGLFGSFPLNYNGMSGTLDIVDGSDELGQAFDFSFSGDFITAAISRQRWTGHKFL